MVRVLIDEDIDIEFRRYLAPIAQAETVQHRGWKGLKNGELLRAAERDFDVFMTMDDHLPDQQNLSAYRLTVLILRSRSKKLVDLLDLIPGVTAALVSLSPGSAVRIYPPDMAV